MITTDLHLDIQAIAPNYELALITIKDRYQVQTRWMMPAQSDHERIEKAILLHIRYSQGVTARN